MISKSNSDKYDKLKKISIFILLFFVFSLTLNSLRGVYDKYKEANLALNRMNNRKVELGNKEVDLSNSLERLESEDGRRFEIRKRLNFSEVGESVAIIVESEGAEEKYKQNKSFFDKIKNIFKKE